MNDLTGMADEPDNLMLHLLRQLDAKMDRVLEDVHDLKVRVTALDEGQAGIYQGLAGVNRRLDRLDERTVRIEKRLDLVDTAP